MSAKDINVLAAKFEFMEKQMEDLKENQNSKFEEMRDDHLRYTEKIEKIISEHIIEREKELQLILERIDKKFEDKADRWVQKVVSFVLSTWGWILITAFMYLIIKTH